MLFKFKSRFYIFTTVKNSIRFCIFKAVQLIQVLVYKISSDFTYYVQETVGDLFFITTTKAEEMNLHYYNERCMEVLKNVPV
jgi:hypothetical protein